MHTNPFVGAVGWAGPLLAQAGRPADGDPVAGAAAGLYSVLSN